MTDALYERVVAALGAQYDVQSEIGRGGMSVVYRALDRRLNRPVAIKVLPPELAYDPAIRTRFTREAQTAALLAHAHIVPIYDVGERDGIAYFVMALVSGGSLATLLARDPRRPVDEVRRFIREIADALACAHLHGVIHRDIKPDNVLIYADSGRVAVTDFGIARAVEGGTRLTVTGIAVGTPAYMSPEQAEGSREVDGRSDIYSLGIVAYQMLTGRLPFTGTSSLALLLKHVTERPRPISDFRPEAPRVVRDAIERALMKDPDDRWPTAASLRDALSTGELTPPWRGEREPVQYTSPIPEHRRRERTPVPRSGPVVPRVVGDTIVEPEHFARITAEQREDLRLWHGRMSLRDRVVTLRRYAWCSAALAVASVIGMVAGLSDGVPPAILAPVIPGFMLVKSWRRAKSLRASGLSLRRVLLMPRAKWVFRERGQTALPRPVRSLAQQLLGGAHGAAIRRAIQDHAAILEILASLSKTDRALVPDIRPTADALVERVIRLAEVVARPEHDQDMRDVEELDARIAEVEREKETPERDRRLTHLRRQRDVATESGQLREALPRQLEGAALALASLRLDVGRLRSGVMSSALADVTSATQEARAVSREIGRLLEAAAEVKSL